LVLTSNEEYLQLYQSLNEPKKIYEKYCSWKENQKIEHVLDYLLYLAEKSNIMILFYEIQWEQSFVDLIGKQKKKHDYISHDHKKL